MDSLIKQMRVRFSGIGDEGLEGAAGVREQKLPPQRTQSFKGARKTPNWLERQFSGRIAQDDLSDSSEYATVIAAAAFAVNSLEEQNQKKNSDNRVIGWTKSKTWKDNIAIGSSTDPGRISRRFSGKEIMENKQTRGSGTEMSGSVPIGRSLSERFSGAAPTIKKNPSFSNVNQEGTNSMRHGTTINKAPSLTRSSSTSNIEGRILEKPRVPRNDRKANAWEKAEMERIKKKYDRTNTTIISWENDKKAKAKHRIEKSELKGRRTRSTQRYNTDISRIDQIAGGARAVADQKRQDEVARVKEKAKKIRATGKVPTTCFCC